MKNKKFFIFFLTFFSLFLMINSFNYSPIASIVGDYYYQPFTYANGTRNFNWSDRGEVWGDATDTLDNYFEISSNALLFSPVDTDDSEKAYLNLTYVETNDIQFEITSFTGQGIAGNDMYVYWNIYNEQDDLLIQIVFRVMGENDSATFKIVSGTTTYHSSDHRPWAQYQGVYNIELENSNTTIHFFKNSGTHRFSEWIPISSSQFSYLTYFRFKSLSNNSGYANIAFDNLYILYNVGYQWEIESGYTLGEVVGNVSTTYPNTLTSSETYQILEKEVQHNLGMIFIEQFAFVIDDSTDLSDIGILLHLESVDFGSYDVSFHWQDRYILVWEGIQHSFIGDTLLIEILIYGVSMPTTFSYPVSYTDIDNDAETTFYESIGLTSSVLPHWNGIYDGTNYYNTAEFLYKIWSYESDGYGTLSFRVFDDITGTPLDFANCVSEGQYSTSDNYVLGRILIYSGDFENELFYNKNYYKRNIEFIDGSAYFVSNNTSNVKVTSCAYGNPFGEVNGVPVVWQSLNNSFLLYNGNGYDIYLKRVGQPDSLPFNWSYYRDLYGDFYIEFVGETEGQVYYKGDTPYYVCNLSDNFLNLSEPTRRYRVIVYRDTEQGNAFFINFPYGQDYVNGTYKMSGYVFPRDGNYFISLYTYNETNKTEDKLLYVSDTINVRGNNTYNPPSTTTETFNNILPFVIIVIFMSIGAGIGIKANSFNAIMVLSLLFGLVGTIICVFIGLIPLWIMFIFALCLGAFIVYRLTLNSG